MEPTLLDLLSLPDPSDFIVFERSPLVLAICQVRFTRVLGVAETAFVAPFQRAIQSTYPIVNQTQEISLEVEAAVAGQRVQQEARSNRWEFQDREDNWKIVLAEESLAIETRAYDSFSDFLQRLRDALTALVDHVGPSIGTRIGLRYINEIRLDENEPVDVLNRELLGPLAVPDLAAGLEQSVQQLLLRYPERYGVNVRHGYLPAGTMVKPRPGDEVPAGPFYLLDLDAFREFQLPSGLSMDVDTISGYVQDFNRALYRFFRWAITPEYVSRMGVRRYAHEHSDH